MSNSLDLALDQEGHSSCLSCAGSKMIAKAISRGQKSIFYLLYFRWREDSAAFIAPYCKKTSA